MQTINCKNIREQMMTEAKIELTKIFAGTGKEPKLVVIQVEGDTASDTYVKNKIKTGKECGVYVEHIKLKNDITEECLRKVIKAANDDTEVTGILLQLPLPKHLKGKEQSLINEIDWKKDVDGLSTESIGRMWSNQESILPCTAAGIMRILPKDMGGMSVALINRSSLIGKPLIKLLEERNATTTWIHSKTSNETKYRALKTSDIIITATGNPKWLNFESIATIKNNMASWNVDMIIDGGMCRDENNKLCGDVDLSSFDLAHILITPTPGGTGILTTAQLMLNVVHAYKLQYGDIPFTANNICK